MEEIVLGAFRESTHVKELFVSENCGKIVRVAEAVIRALKEGRKILLFGNGGSAADAQHIAAEFVNRFMIERPPLPALSLAADSSVLTSIGNDYDFADIFAKQIRALGREHDIAWGLTTSGSSPNVVRGLETARKMNLVTVAFTGKDGGEAGKVADHVLSVPSKSVPRIQEVHITIGHVICQLVDYRLFQKPELG